MPQQHPTRASLRRPTRARRSTRVHAVTTGAAIVAAAALTATTAVPSGLPTTKPAVRATPTPGAKAVTVRGSTVVGTNVAALHADPQTTAVVEAAVAQASGALAQAELVTTEGVGAAADAIEQIEQTTSVVRELVRRVSTVDDDGAPATAEPSPASTAADGSATEPAASAAETSPSTGAHSTIAAAADAAVTAVTGDGAADDVDAEAVAVAVALEQQTAALEELIDDTPAATVTVTPGPSPEEIAAQKAAEEAAAAAAAREAEVARLAALAAEAQQYGNGELPEHVMAELPWSPGSTLRADAADALIRMNEAFKAAFGTDLGINSAYRSFADQVAVKRQRGFWAAVPGYSNHGYGVAVDLGTGIADFGSPQFAWMAENAPTFGWNHPDWAGQSGRKPEPWHWEYTG